MLAYIYARWSSLEQTKGSTLQRQLDACGEYIASQPGWTVVETLTDRGKSAYTGDNIETGALGKFRDRIMSGALEAKNVCLVVEELDRLSRQPADVMLSWLSPLVRKGLSIKVVNTGQMITSDMLDHDMGGLMMILIGAFGSYTESRKKAKRVAAAWEAKREKARAGEPVALKARNHRRPKWVEIDAAGEFFVPAVKREIVRLIFENRAAGIGKGLTAKNLNKMALEDSRYATWELDAGERKAPKLWTATYVGRILRNRAVMGEWQPYARPRKGEPQALEPISNYYPAIIDPALFVRANDNRIADALKHQGRGKGLSNLLGSRARCGTCGGQMSALGSATFRTNKLRQVRRHYSFYCGTNKTGGACENGRGWGYDRVEGPILDRILTLAMDDQHFGSIDTDTGALEAAVHHAKASISELSLKIERLMDSIENGGGDLAQSRLITRQRELSDAEDALEGAEAALAEAKGKVSPSEHIRRVAEVRELMTSPDEDERFQARSRVKAALGSLIDKITFHPETGHVTVLLVDRSRQFVIANATTVARGGHLKSGAVIPDAEIISDIDLTKFGGGPGYGRVRITSNGKSRYENDLTGDQKVASAAYARRNAAARDKKTAADPK